MYLDLYTLLRDVGSEKGILYGPALLHLPLPLDISQYRSQLYRGDEPRTYFTMIPFLLTRNDLKGPRFCSGGRGGSRVNRRVLPF